MSVFYLDEESWSEVFVSASFTFAPAHAMLWTGTKIELPDPPRSARYLSVWSYRKNGASGAASAAAAGALGEAKWIVGPVGADKLLQALVQAASTVDWTHPTAPDTFNNPQKFVVFASRYQIRPLDSPASRRKKADLPVVSPVGSPRSVNGGSSAGHDSSGPCCCTYGFAEMTPETRKFYDDLLAQREQHADVEQAETEQITWNLGANLRVV